MKKTKKLLLAVLSALTAGVCALGVAGCDLSKSEYSQTDEKNSEESKKEESLETDDGEEESSKEEDDSAKFSEGLGYKLSEDETYYTVSGRGSCKDTNIIIPEEYNGLPVAGIGARAFYGVQGLTSVTIPNSVTSIGYSAFFACNQLTSVGVQNRQ